MQFVRQSILQTVLVVMMTVATSAAQPLPLYLHAVGAKMVDTHGNTVLLRGVNTGAWLFYDPFWYDGGVGLEGDWDDGGDTTHFITPQITALVGTNPKYNVDQIKKAFWANFISAGDVAAIKRAGFNSIRVPMDYRLFGSTATDDDGNHVVIPSATAPGFAYLDDFIAQCRVAHIYVILDMHVLPHGFSDDQKSLNSLAALWKFIALRYRNEPYVGGYDLINEPNWNGEAYSLNATGKGKDWNTGCQYVMQQLIDAVREVDRRHMIVVESFMFDDQLDSDFYNVKTGALCQTLQLDDPAHNLALSYHRYGGTLPDQYDAAKDPGPNGSHYWWDEDPEFKMQHAKKLAQMANCPLWIGEFGNNQNVWYSKLVSLAERSDQADDFGISAGWCLWTYKKSGYDVISNITQTPGIISISKYYGQLSNWWKNGSKGEEPTPSFTPTQADEWLYDYALHTNARYCTINRDQVDVLLRKDFMTRAVPYREGTTIPGVINATDYDMGANGLGYHTDGDFNDSWNYRLDGVQLRPSPDSGGSGFIVGSVAAGEWLKYTVTATPGRYTLKIRYALGENRNADLRITVNGLTAVDSAVLPSTGSWSNYQTAVLPDVNVSASGTAVVQITAISGCDLNWVSFDKPG